MWRHRFLWLVSFTLLSLPLSLSAQTTTGSIRGYITDQQDAPVAEAQIVARDVRNGQQTTASSQRNGFYLLAGLTPSTYEVTVRLIGSAPQSRRLDVLIGQTLTLDFKLTQSAVELTEVQVVAAPAVEMRTSEVATNVTQQQVNNLPSSSRNFLDLASLAPGTSIENDRLNGTARRLSAGAQSADQINVFIDGASYKNDLIHGGVVGQDRSRGNPFPRNAIQEFRILTQNYKAEYQKSSSAVLTATTRSGGNDWSGTAFVSYQNKGFVALDSVQSFDKRIADSIAEANGTPSTFREPDYSRQLVGLSMGGPIARDRLFFFGSYEGNYQTRSNRVDIVPPAGFPALDTVDFASRNGFFDSPFRETLLFGKLNYAPGSNSTLELSYNGRYEHDTRDFGGLRPFETGVRFNNQVSTGLLKFRHTGGLWLNESMISYQRSRDNPSPVPGSGVVNRFYGFGCCAQLGPDITIQDFTQTRIGVRHDVSYAGWQWSGQHVLKGGVSLDFLNYRVLKQNGVIPRFVYEQFPQGGSATAPDSFAIPDRVEFRAGNPNFLTDNQQFGIYAQDDWSITQRLTLNLGLRWDYETHMMNYNYVTPQPIVDSLTKYADSMFIPIDPARYFTNGTQRPRFMGAVQPRLGFSYALDEGGRTTLFGGYGIFYDRTLFDQSIEEQFAQQQPNILIRFRVPGDTTSGRVDWDNRYLDGRAALDSLRIANPQAGRPEVKLIPNDLRPPRSTQFSFGVRRLFGSIAVDAAYTGIRSKNVFTFYWANFNFTCPERSFGVSGCAVNRNVPGFGTILLATNAGRTWYDALQVKVDRPFRFSAAGGIGWGAGLAYTYATRETEGFNDDFSFPNPVDYPRQVRNDEKHRLVANWIMDIPFAFGIQFSGLLTMGSGLRYDLGDRFGGTGNPFRPGALDPPMFKNLDLRVRKDFPATRGARLGVTLDLFNAFNWWSYSYNNNGTIAGPVNDPRRFQLGAELGF
jgi:outer membrane receptor protein involved in Fe transport